MKRRRSDKEQDTERGKRNTQELASATAEDKETQLRITLRWRLMGGNKKGHRVATAAPARGNSPLRAIPNATVSEGRSFPLRAAPIFPHRARCGSSVLGDLRVASGPRRAGDHTVPYHPRVPPWTWDWYNITLMAVSAIGSTNTSYQ